MYNVGMRVRVLDNYAGGLENVIGRTGKIVAFGRGGEMVLDIKGERKATWGDYRFEYAVIVKPLEVSKVDFDIKDVNGRKIELGDEVAYGSYGGGITLGTVIDIDEREDGYGRKTVKFRLEMPNPQSYSDGGDRKVAGKVVMAYRWYQNPNQAIIIRKGLNSF